MTAKRHSRSGFRTPAFAGVAEIPHYQKEKTMDLRYCMHEGEDSWWEYDARGIPLCKVCDRCEETKLSMYRPEVLTNSNYTADEPIEPETY
jgi:hypothetical protein